MSELANLGITDYVVFSIVLGMSFVIGILSSLKSSNSPADFLTASRSMHYLPVGFSLVTSFISSISLLGMSGDAYASGIQLYIFAFSTVAGMYLTTHTSLPVFAALEVTSMNEYLLMRFKSKSLMKFVSGMFILKKMTYMGICLYAPTIALSAVTSLDTFTYIYILGIICTIYSSIGGMRAVVWTDVFQMVIMAAGMVVVVVLGCLEVGGLGEVWRISSEGNRTELFDFNPSPFVRQTFWNTLVQGLVVSSFAFGIDQLNLQRMCSVPTEADARKVLLVSGIGMVILYGFVFLTGLAAYAVYASCDPLKLGLIEKKEEILPYFIMDRASHIYGLPGLFIAALFSGTLSSLSSALNGSVAMIWKDFLADIPYFKKASDNVTTMTNRLISVILGLMTIGVSVLCSKSESLIDFSMTAASVFTGPVYGVFLLGLLFPFCTSIGAWAGLLTSWVFVLWVAIGSMLYSPATEYLPSSIDSCNSTDVFQSFDNSTLLDDVTQGFVAPPGSIYNISYLLYGAFATLWSVVVGVMVTYATGKQDLADVSPVLISPFVRRMFWKEPLDLVTLTQKVKQYRAIPDHDEPSAQKETSMFDQ